MPDRTSAAAPVPAPAADDRAPRAWIAPAVATAVTLPLAFLAFVFVALSPMACGNCSGARRAAFSATFMTAFWTFAIGLLLPLGLLVTSWVLPWRQRHTARRRKVAALAPTAVVVLYLLFLALVDWP
ncbi:hypothetical protein R1T08_04555 [Streptomyces sp. SBC-4]|nr:hypothetical protein [Streptomyces sp. SBC-4]MDV5143577.1 hypothetical protein [Streptomyces sp. SBC-4]